MGLLLAHLVREGANFGSGTVGLLAAVFYGTELLGAPWFGVLSDRHGRRIFMIAGPILGGIAVQLIGWPRVLAAMVAGRLLEGLSSASSVPATLSYLSAATSEGGAGRIRTMAWYEIATVGGIAAGLVAGGLLWDLLGSWAFLAVTGIYVASLLAFWSARDAVTVGTNTVPSTEKTSLMAVLRRPEILRFAPAWLAVNTIVGTWFTHSTFLLTGQVRVGQNLMGSMSGSQISLAFALVGGAFMLGIYLWGMNTGNRLRTNVMLASLPGVILVCAGLVGINHLYQADVLFTGTILVGVVVVSGFTPAALSYLADLSEADPNARGSVMGLYSVLLGLGQLLGGVIGGPFAQIGGVDGLILLTGLLGIVAAVVVVILRRSELAERLGAA